MAAVTADCADGRTDGRGRTDRRKPDVGNGNPTRGRSKVSQSEELETVLRGRRILLRVDEREEGVAGCGPILLFLRLLPFLFPLHAIPIPSFVRPSIGIGRDACFVRHAERSAAFECFFFTDSVRVP